MLVTFSVDPDVFTPCSEGEVKEQIFFHKLLLEVWEESGMLVVPNTSEKNSVLYSRLRQANPNVQKIWVAALKSLRKRPMTTNHEDVISSLERPTKTALQNISVQILSLEKTRAELWGIGADKVGTPMGHDVELCLFGHERATKAFQASKTLGRKPITPGSTFGEFWATRLVGFAENSRHIVISDRFLAKTTERSGSPALKEMISRISKLSPRVKRLVEIYTSIEEDADFSITQIEREVREALKGAPPDSGLLEVKICVCNAREFRKIEHYRFILFDSLNLVLIDKGLSVFSKKGNEILSTATYPVQVLPWMLEEMQSYRDDYKSIRHIVEKEKTISV